jgi:hypothetical protein
MPASFSDFLLGNGKPDNGAHPIKFVFLFIFAIISFVYFCITCFEQDRKRVERKKRRYERQEAEVREFEREKDKGRSRSGKGGSSRSEKGGSSRNGKGGSSRSGSRMRGGRDGGREYDGAGGGGASFVSVSEESGSSRS